MIRKTKRNGANPDPQSAKSQAEAAYNYIIQKMPLWTEENIENINMAYDGLSLKENNESIDCIGTLVANENGEVLCIKDDCDDIAHDHNRSIAKNNALITKLGGTISNSYLNK